MLAAEGDDGVHTTTTQLAELICSEVIAIVIFGIVIFGALLG
ncbi:hypothetical protein MDOR_28150 [Mycolicibacterium doricum]|jgi:hypothetical protein|uniref:Uncharacterized protein n=1 Tax=Mycolicibacterium doricum TaxID=126673 RepID=A0A7I7VTM7_9MYCO|nr:hypothetical protein [Mycolicibacterium doricum]BBZ08646.1 hypothetical protein MDOR_28150 [Mycolicibacterium doricum]